MMSRIRVVTQLPPILMSLSMGQQWCNMITLIDMILVLTCMLCAMHAGSWATWSATVQCQTSQGYGLFSIMIRSPARQIGLGPRGWSVAGFVRVGRTVKSGRSRHLGSSSQDCFQTSSRDLSLPLCIMPLFCPPALLRQARHKPCPCYASPVRSPR